MDIEKNLAINNLNSINNFINKLNDEHDLLVNELRNNLEIDNKVIEEEKLLLIKNNNLKIIEDIHETIKILDI